jgi:hypothetical protein
LTAFGLALGWGVRAEATVLTFDRAGTSGQFSASFNQNALFGAPSTTAFPDYGDNASGAAEDASAARGQGTGTTIFQYGTAGGPTPQVVVDYFVGNNGNIGAGLEGAYVYNAATNMTPPPPAYFPYSVDTTNNRLFTLTADAGYEVVFEAFTIGDFGFARTIDSLKLIGIDDANNETVLWDSGLTNIPAAGRTFTVTDFGGPVVFRRVALDFDPQGGHNNFAFDDIQFGQQQIPEPATLSLLVAGAAGLARRRRP